jgi:phosphatidylserine/phosphatidylglycerophosphate/cardiolipin synthase-like enzyme
MRLLETLGPAQLDAISAKLRTGASASAPTTDRSAANSSVNDTVVSLVQRLGENATCVLFDALAEERRISDRNADRRLELVWTGPEREGAGTRDTSVAVRELFSQAERSVLVSAYAVFGGKEIFRPLALRMQERPGLDVQLYLNVAHDEDVGAPEEQLLRRFRTRFLDREWPGGPTPRLFFDRRSLAQRASTRAVLHAKCVIIDDQRCLITSANFTEAAHIRNIEVGVLVNDGLFAKSVAMQFRALVDTGDLVEMTT